MEPGQAVIACPTCGQLQRYESPPPGGALECCRCRSLLVEFKRAGVAVPAALALAALVLYVPAILYPILNMNLHGVYSESTVWDGVVSLVRHHQWPVAVIVFMASIVIPLMKLLGLFFLTATAHFGIRRWMHARTRIYRFIDVIGPWAMLDVFLLAILVALVKLGQLATVLPGRGLLAFASVVVLTILASASFDPKLIWQSEGPRR